QAVAQRRLTEEQRQQADANLRQARQAVDEYYTAVSESDLLNVPGLQPLRRKLLNSALKYYQGFLAQRQDDARAHGDVAAAFLRVGRLTHAVGSQQEALQACQKACALYEELVSQDPS